MAKIIRVFLDADNLRIELANLCERFNISFGEESQGFGKALSELPEKLPAADVRPERHGHWIRDDYQERDFDGSYSKVVSYRCSRCNKNTDYKMTIFCGNCGAKMDGKDGESDERA